MAKHLADAGEFDWAITALFYSALQLVEAYFLQSGLEARVGKDRRGLPDSVTIERRRKV